MHVRGRGFSCIIIWMLVDQAGKSNGYNNFDDVGCRSMHDEIIRNSEDQLLGIYSLRPKLSVLTLVQLCINFSTKLRHLFWDGESI